MATYRSLLLPAVLSLLALSLSACGDGDQGDVSRSPESSGLSRTFAMGLSSLPPELTDESYGQTFELAAGAGEVILIRRTPPWGELLTDSDFPSDGTVETTQREIALAEEHGLNVFFAIDATDVSEDTFQLADLPDDLLGATYADDDVRQALITYAGYVAVNYKPAYLALGVDVNRYQVQNPDDFEQFVTLYHEGYEAIKELSPETLVFPTFQMEELQGLLPKEDPHQPQWQLINRFTPKNDLLAVSTYPGLAFADPEQIPSDYYTQLSLFTDLPVAITEIGYSSEAMDGNGDEATESQQAAFLRRALADADELEMPLVVWFASQDPIFTGKSPLDLVQHIGLKRQDGTAKPAWSVWIGAARRPLAEQGARAP